MLPEVSYMCEGPMRVSSGPHGLRGTAVLARVIHIQAMAESFSYRSDDSDSDDSDGPMVSVQIMMPYCRCRRRELFLLWWTSDQDFGLCFRCGSLVLLRDLSASERFCYLVLLNMWHGPRIFRREFFIRVHSRSLRGFPDS